MELPVSSSTGSLAFSLHPNQAVVRSFQGTNCRIDSLTRRVGIGYTVAWLRDATRDEARVAPLVVDGFYLVNA